jgi:hypothetical protein
MSNTLRIRAEAEPTNTRRVRVRAFAFQERVPPVELQLWNLGDNPTDYGVHKWTPRSAADVMGRYEARGNPLLIDVEHNGAKDEAGEPAITGGYARLELRAGAPWLVFDWSAFACAQIAAGERRFLSPEYDVDRTTGEIVALYRVSLVADPGTHRARMLAAAKQETRSMNPTLAAIMAVLGSVTDPAAAIESIKSLVSALSEGGDAGAGAGAGGDAGDGSAVGEIAAAPGDAPAGGGDAPAGGGDAPSDGKDKDKVAAGAKPGSGPPAQHVQTAAKPAAKPAGKPAAPPAAAASTPVGVDTAAVDKVAAAAVQQINDAQRDHLIATQGSRLDPSIRRWASSQSLAVVSGLINAAPAELQPLGAVQATRGDTHGKAAAPKGLEGAELDELKKNMGTFKASTPEVPHMTAAGIFVLPTVTPRAFRERKRVEAAAIAAGKAGK